MYCIIITGLPASGKTVMAKTISERFHLPVFSKDRIKERLYDEVGFGSREEKVKLGIASMKIMYDEAEQMMMLEMPFILENNFENISREGLFSLLEKYHYTAVTVRMTGDYKALYSRFAKRNESPNRHRGHVVDDRYPEAETDRKVKTMPYERYMKMVSERGMDSFTGNGPCITADTTDFFTFDCEQVIEQIRQCISEISGGE